MSADQLAAVCAQYQLRQPTQVAAVSRAYQVFHDHHATFVAAVSADMLVDLRRDVAHNQSRIVFLGRDGHSYAAAVREFDPEFFARHASEIVLSRALVESALTDLEQRTGAHLDAVESFRMRDRIDPSASTGAFQRLSNYFDDAGVPTSGSVTFVDNSFKGTIQELYSAAYPNAQAYGRYAIHGAHPDDPHPGTKTGYALNQPANATWRGYPLTELPRDPKLTFGSAAAVAAIEHTLHGPYTSPAALGPAGPIQTPQYSQPDPLRGLNPQVVAPEYREPRVRDAVKVAALLAVADKARQVRPRWTGEQHGQTQGERDQAVANFAKQLRLWITSAPGRDRDLSRVLDSFVRRKPAEIAANANPSFPRPLTLPKAVGPTRSAGPQRRPPSVGGRAGLGR